MWWTSRTAPVPINARSTAWAARRWPAPADADSTSTLPSSAILFSRCEISVGVEPFSDCNEPGPESEDKRRAVNAPWRNRLAEDAIHLLDRVRNEYGSN